MFLKKDIPSDSSSAQPVDVNKRDGAKAMAGTNSDVVNNRRAIRLANMNAAEALKAELAGAVPLGREPKVSLSNVTPAQDTEASIERTVDVTTNDEEVAEVSPLDYQNAMDIQAEYVEGASQVQLLEEVDSSEVRTAPAGTSSELAADVITSEPDSVMPFDTDLGATIEPTDSTVVPDNAEVFNSEAPEADAHGTKRKADEMVADGEGEEEPMDVEEEEVAAPVARKINADGTVEQEDTVKSVIMYNFPLLNTHFYLIGYGNQATKNDTTVKSLEWN